MANIWTEEGMLEYWDSIERDDRYDPEWIVPFLKERENKELNWCLTYPAHGTDGHLKFMLIQALYDALDTAWRVMDDDQREQVKEVFLARQST